MFLFTLRSCVVWYTRAPNNHLDRISVLRICSLARSKLVWCVLIGSARPEIFHWIEWTEKPSSFILYIHFGYNSSIGHKLNRTWSIQFRFLIVHSGACMRYTMQLKHARWSETFSFLFLIFVSLLLFLVYTLFLVRSLIWSLSFISHTTLQSVKGGIAFHRGSLNWNFLCSLKKIDAFFAGRGSAWFLRSLLFSRCSSHSHSFLASPEEM